jgi:hypothetical protein
MRKLFKNNLFRIFIMSNRSIAGARQRRAGDPTPTVGPRSNTSIGSQQIFAKQQIQHPPQMQRPQQQQKNMVTNQVQNVAPDHNDQQQMSKLSIPKAFTLVTLRLGRIEQFIQHLQEDGILQPYDRQCENIVEDEYLKNLLSRIEYLEKNNKVVTTPIPNIDNSAVEELKANYSKLEKDLRETKDLLMIIMMKYEKSTLDVNDKISQLFTIIEQLTKPVISTDENNTTIQSDHDHIHDHIHDHYNEDNNEHIKEYTEDEPISAVNLKEEIESELAKEVLNN